MTSESIFQQDVEKFFVSVDHSRTSHVWKYFGILTYEDDGKRRSVSNQYFCKECLNKAVATDGKAPFNKYKIKHYARSIATSNLAAHLRDDHRITEEAKAPSRSGMKDFFTVTPRPSSSGTGDRKSLLARDFVLWVARDLLPFSLVDGEGLQDFLLKYRVIQNVEDLPDRTTLSRGALSDVYCDLHAKVKGLLSSASFCALTFDLWTDAYRRKGFITFTCHFCDANFVLKSVTLSTRNLFQRHTGIAILDEYTKCVEEFNISSKVVCCVTDAGSNVKRAVSLAGVSNHLCLGHGLHNLVLRDGFAHVEELHELLVKCRALVQKLHYKSAQLEELAESELQKALLEFVSVGEHLDDDENDPVTDTSADDHSYTASVPHQCVSIKGDTPTRWHSILMMFDSLIDNRKHLQKLLAPTDERIVLTPEEWSVMQDLSDFLKKLRTSVELLSQEKCCTYNLILIVNSVVAECIEENDADHVLVQELKKCMRERFDHRFPVSDVAVVASLLDPRFQNLYVVQNFLDKKGVTKVDFLVEQTLKHVKSSDVTERVTTSSTSGANCLEELAMRHSTSSFDMCNSVRAECHSLLGLPSTVPNGDLLGFWKSVSGQYPWLSSLAKKLLCIPATSTPSERVFSVAGQVLRAKRSRLHPHTVDKLIFIHDNYSVAKG